MISTVVTKEKLYALARENNILRTFIQQHEFGGLPWESVLASCVYYLVKENEAKDKMICKYLELHTFNVSLSREEILK